MMGAAVFGVGQGYVGNNSTRQRGTDLLENMSITNQTYPTGELVMSASVTAQSTRRLKDLSSTFQRIKWHRLVFTIEGAFPTTTGGGYIAAFVRDPTDVPPSDGLERLRWVAARSCMVDCKWYDCGRVIVPVTPDLQYTSHDQKDDPRWWSPGTLYVISKGGPGQPGSLTIKLDWDITLSMPSSEREEEASPTSTFPQDLVVTAKVSGAGQLALMEQSSWTSSTVGDYSAPLSSFLDQYPDDTIFKIANPIFVASGVGSWAVHRFHLKTGSTSVKNDGTQGTVRTLYLINDFEPETFFGGSNASASFGIAVPEGLPFTAEPPGTQVVQNFMNVFTPKGIQRIKTAGLSLRTTREPVPADWPTVNAYVQGEASRR